MAGLLPAGAGEEPRGTRRTRIARAALAVFAIAFGAGVANAEPPIGSRLGERLERRNASSSDTSIRGSHTVAGCLYNKRKSMVRSFLDTESTDESDRYDKSLRREVECSHLVIPSEFAEAQVFHVPNDIFRGLLAEAVLDDERGLESLPALPIEQGYQRSWFSMTGRDGTVDEMAACAAETNPAGVRALLATRAQRKEEASAVNALGPTLGSCLRTGATLKANRQSLRAALAEALYHRVFTSLPAAATPSAPALK